MKETTAYQTHDGLLFKNKFKAEYHELENKFSNWYDNKPEQLSAEVDGEELLEFINDNRDVLGSYIDTLCEIDKKEF